MVGRGTPEKSKEHPKLRISPFKKTGIVDSTCFVPSKTSGREKKFLGLVQIENKAHRWFCICTSSRNVFSCSEFLGTKQVDSPVGSTCSVDSTVCRRIGTPGKQIKNQNFVAVVAKTSSWVGWPSCVGSSLGWGFWSRLVLQLNFIWVIPNRWSRCSSYNHINSNPWYKTSAPTRAAWF